MVYEAIDCTTLVEDYEYQYKYHQYSCLFYSDIHIKMKSYLVLFISFTFQCSCEYSEHIFIDTRKFDIKITVLLYNQFTITRECNAMLSLSCACVKHRSVFNFKSPFTKKGIKTIQFVSKSNNPNFSTRTTSVTLTLGDT